MKKSDFDAAFEAQVTDKNAILWHGADDPTSLLWDLLSVAFEGYDLAAKRNDKLFTYAERALDDRMANIMATPRGAVLHKFLKRRVYVLMMKGDGNLTEDEVKELKAVASACQGYESEAHNIFEEKESAA